MVKYFVKGRISNVRFLEAKGARKVRVGQYWAYEMTFADDDWDGIKELHLLIEGDENVPGIEKVWLEEDVRVELPDEEEEAPEAIYPGWQGMVEAMLERGYKSVSNEDVRLLMLDQVAGLKNRALRRRAGSIDIGRLDEIYEQFSRCYDEAAAEFYLSVRDELRAFSTKYWK